MLVYALSGAMCAHRRHHHGGALQFGPRRPWQILSADHGAGLLPRGGQSVRRLREVDTGIPGARHAATAVFGAQPAGRQPALATAIWGILLVRRHDPAVASAGQLMHFQHARSEPNEGLWCSHEHVDERLDRPGAEHAVAAVSRYGLDFIEISLLDPPLSMLRIAAQLLAENDLPGRLLAWPAPARMGVRHARTRPSTFSQWPSTKRPTWRLGAFGVIYGGIGERTGMPPTEKEYDNIAKVHDCCRQAGQGAGHRTRRGSRQSLREPPDQYRLRRRLR